MKIDATLRPEAVGEIQAIEEVTVAAYRRLGCRNIPRLVFEGVPPEVFLHLYLGHHERRAKPAWSRG